MPGSALSVVFVKESVRDYRGARRTRLIRRDPAAQCDRLPEAGCGEELASVGALIGATEPGAAARGGVAAYSAAAGITGRRQRRRAPPAQKRLAISKEATTTSTSRGRPASMIIP